MLLCCKDKTCSIITMVDVIKATGQVEPFSEEKLRYSIHRAGIPDEIQNQVIHHIKERLYENIPTSEIYRHITEFLVQTNKSHVKAKYSLKQAIMDLGPTGYPFEDFIEEVLKQQGYSTKVRTLLQGSCINHEIDILAEKDGKAIAVEAKFHNGSGTRTDVHVALYTHARFNDVKARNHIQESWVITNTKATVDAMNYASCVGMKIISWNYPEGGSLRDMVEKAKLTPLTTLTSLSDAQKQILMQNHIVLCKEIIDNPQSISTLGLSDEKKKALFEEVNFILNHQ